jgi:D-3-phosphoglycerate dehydrogenase
MRFLVVGDPLLSSATLASAVRDVFGANAEVSQVDWQPANEEEFWFLRSQVEKLGAGAGKPPAELNDKIQNIDVIITHHTPLNAQLIHRSSASYIGVCRAGTENIDVKAAADQGIQVMKTMGRNAEAVSDFTIALMLAELRNLARGHAALMQGEWKKKYANSAFMGDMRDKTIGLVGFGFIGRLVAQKLLNFGVRILVYDPYAGQDTLLKFGAEAVSLEELCRQSDFISIHARLGKDTTGLIGREAFSWMKSTAYLINTARAGLVDEAALIAALEERRIGGAALDVFWTEPLPAGHPLLRMDNVTITPHLAGATLDTFRMTPYLLLRELKRVIDTNAVSEWIVS